MVEKLSQTDEVMQPITSFRVLACRVIWCFAGPIALIFMAFKIATTQDGWASVSDLGFPLIVIATVAARWVCFRAGDRTDSLGAVTSLEQLRRYSLFYSTGAASLWLVANIIGNLIRH